MKPLLAATTALLLAQGPAMAAVSGFYDSAEQIATILSDGAVADALRQSPVDQIEYEGALGDGVLEWEIDSRDCDLSVYLRAVPPADGMPGKTLYQVDRISECR